MRELTPLFFCLGLLAAAGARAEEAPIPLALSNDHVAILPLPANTVTLVLDNPRVADVSLENGILTVIGHQTGSTGLRVLGSGGQSLAAYEINVRPDDADTLKIFEGGAKRQSYSCTPECAPVVASGDDPNFIRRVMTDAAVAPKGK